MKSLKELYRIGKGPSSSHTMGPNKAAKDFAERHLDAASFEVTLYGSLAATGKGHMTDVAIIEVLERIAPVSIVWKPEVFFLIIPTGCASSRLTPKTTRRMSGRCTVSAAERCPRAGRTTGS